MTSETGTCRTALWEASPADEALVRQLAAATGLSAVVARILVGRGVDTAASVRAFLEPSLKRDWPHAEAIPGLEGAARRVADAVIEHERIVVFGDFDLDGISAAATAALGLKALGADVEATVPHRFREGYGLTVAALERLVTMEPDLVITVDCGISNGVEVAALRARGIDVVVTDHHEPGDGLPADVPVADPKLSPDGPPLAGAGVALALVREVGHLLGRAEVWRELTDVAMLGTVADIVPLVGANRALVADGVERARTGPRPGVAALARVAGIALADLTSDQVAFGLAPRLNAAGRMDDPALALAVLMTDDDDEAARLAAALDEHNRARQTADAELFEQALEHVDVAQVYAQRCVVVAGVGWHEGVRGIVASRLVGRFGVPAFVFCIEGDEAHGSGRSVPGVDLHSAVESFASLVIRYGGHEMAMGATVRSDGVDAFRAALARSMVDVPARAFETSLRIDAEVPLDALSRELAAEIAQLGPFGYGNPRPMLAARGVFLNGRARVGRTADHLKFIAYDGAVSVPGIAFRCRDVASLVETETPVDIAFELDVNVWRGSERIQLLARDFHVVARGHDAPAAELVEDLFARADELLAGGEYTGIADEDRFHTKLAGVTFEGRQEIIARLSPGTPLRLERQPENPYDPAACALFDAAGDQVGFLNRRLAAELAPVLDSGVEYDVEVADVTGGGEGESRGLNILISRRGAVEARAIDEAEAALVRQSLSELGEDNLRDEIAARLLGTGSLHEAQADALAILARGASLLCVMATGRGKSLIFHVHAAREAIARGTASIFVYPLRALVADQAFSLEERFAQMGCVVATVTGESSQNARDEAFASLADGLLDVVLTTPEFLDHHASRFAASGRIGFVVVDEAHHVGLSRGGHRPAYARLGHALDVLGRPVTLAVTATAPDEVADAIVRTLGIDELVTDPSVRDNLEIVDKRDLTDKAGYLAALAARGEKSIIYVNSRDVSVKLAREIRRRVPALSGRVAFYNGALNRAARHAVEHAFREGAISVVVATSAFGEGVNIGDVRHVVLYHLPMGEVAFNQLCGRGGRDGKAAEVHLVFGNKDVKLNRMILQSAAPPRDDLAALYSVLRSLAGGDSGEIETTNAELAERVRARRPASVLNESGISTGIGVFRELGLVASEGMGSYRRLRMLPAPSEKLDLASSVRYAEGLDEIEEFEAFAERALKAPAAELLESFNRPILPTRPLRYQT